MDIVYKNSIEEIKLTSMTERTLYIHMKTYKTDFNIISSLKEKKTIFILYFLVLLCKTFYQRYGIVYHLNKLINVFRSV